MVFEQPHLKEMQGSFTKNMVVVISLMLILLCKNAQLLLNCVGHTKASPARQGFFTRELCVHGTISSPC